MRKEFEKKQLKYIPYYQYDVVIIVPDTYLGRIRYFLNPIKFSYIYTGSNKFVDFTFDKEAKSKKGIQTSIVDSRNTKFAESFVSIYRSANRRNRIDSPETELVMFFWRKLHKKAPDLKFYGILG